LSQISNRIGNINTIFVSPITIIYKNKFTKINFMSMEKTSRNNKQYRIGIEFLPKETLLGIHYIECEVDLAQSGKFEEMVGVQIGFIFFTISCMKIKL
jgi:hypothetical protein